MYSVTTDDKQYIPRRRCEEQTHAIKNSSTAGDDHRTEGDVTFAGRSIVVLPLATKIWYRDIL